MKNEINAEDVKTTSEEKEVNNTTNEIVIPDECGDTLWEAVLAQQCKTASITNAINNSQLS